MLQKSLNRLGNVLLLIGVAVWVLYTVGKYILGWDVNIRQFLPYHLVAIIPGVLLRRCSGYFVQKFGSKTDTPVNR